jgi:glycosyltransferase involved in cell wall biosynthesis
MIARMSPNAAGRSPAVGLSSAAVVADGLGNPDAEAPTLLVPVTDVDCPEVSIVVPALNEGLTIGDFVAWCHEGLAKAGVRGEIIIVDSSTDDTAEKALQGGARVLKTQKRGLGRAYIDAIPFIRGRYVIMGDADCTYDFRELAPFIEQLRDGSEFVMGSRFKGYIEPGSMPALHRYFGTPFTTWILNRVYSSHFSDIHCGMRGISLDALERMNIRSQSWEYASEMVLKSVHLDLRTTEVPVRFLADRPGRVSHHKRLGWLSPFQAAWINLRAMFIYGADFFVLKPGLLLLALGLLLLLPLSFGPITIGPITFSLYWQLLGLTLGIVGMQGVMLGCLAKVFFDYTHRRTKRLLALFSYTRATLVAGGLFLLGVLAEVPLVVNYFEHGLRLPEEFGIPNYLGVTGLFLMVAGFTIFIFTLLMNAAAISTGHGVDIR